MFFSHPSRWLLPVSAGESAFTVSAASLSYLGRRSSSCSQGGGLPWVRRRLVSWFLARRYSSVVTWSIIICAESVGGATNKSDVYLSFTYFTGVLLNLSLSAFEQK